MELVILKYIKYTNCMVCFKDFITLLFTGSIILGIPKSLVTM